MNTSQAVDHLCVLIHGLWGKPSHLYHLRDTLQEEFGDHGIEILIPQSNSSNFTYDGIEVGAERITHEIENHIQKIGRAGTKINKISIIGYSLGGLIARFVVGLLYKNGVFENIRPLNFATFATPHLGLRTPTPGFLAQMWNWLGSKMLSTSGQQMFLVDNFRGTGRGLLDVMADPNSIFIKGLRLFKNKTLYANTKNDHSVPFYSASMSRNDPYVDLSVVEPHYLEAQGDLPVLLDPNSPFYLRTESTPSKGLSSPPFGKVILLYAIFYATIPIAILVFFVNGGIQAYCSAQRVKIHEEGRMIDLQRYRMPFFEEVQAMQDNMINHLSRKQINSSSQLFPRPTSEPMFSASLSKSVSTNGKSLVQEPRDKKNRSFPTLALTKEQFQMIDNLEQLGFAKYPAHIINVWHTHAAIVVRMPNPDFEEGRVVVDHWAKSFLK